MAQTGSKLIRVFFPDQGLGTLLQLRLIDHNQCHPRVEPEMQELAETREVTQQTYCRAETDRTFYNATQLTGGVNNLFSFRNVTPLDRQTVVRMNKDTLYTVALVDTSKGATITVPEMPAGRYFSVLLLDNGMVQTAGHVNQPLPANYYSGKPFGVKSFPEPLDIPCEVSGLTAACLAVRREVFDEVGGFCEDLPNNFNDVDFCLKIQQTGRSLIWTPLARLYHFETTTRVTTVTEEETQFIKDRWGRTFGVDLYRSRID
jgi:hypothetical protein